MAEIARESERHIIHDLSDGLIRYEAAWVSVLNGYGPDPTSTGWKRFRQHMSFFMPAGWSNWGNPSPGTPLGPPQYGPTIVGDALHVEQALATVTPMAFGQDSLSGPNGLQQGFFGIAVDNFGAGWLNNPWGDLVTEKGGPTSLSMEVFANIAFEGPMTWLGRLGVHVTVIGRRVPFRFNFGV